MGGRLVLMPTLVAFAGAACVIALTVLVTFYRFEAELGRIFEDRVRIVLNDIEDGLEDELALGLPLSSLLDVNNGLRESVRAYREVELIEVFGREGTVLFSSDPSFVGDSVPLSWLEGWQAEGDGLWYLRDTSRHVIGATLNNEVGSPLGGVGIAYRVDGFDSLGPDTRKHLLIGVGVVLVFAFACLLIGMALVTRTTRRSLGLMEARAPSLIDAPPRRTDQPASPTLSVGPAAAEPGENEPGFTPTGIEAFDRCFATAEAASRAVADARQAIHSLDLDA